GDGAGAPAGGARCADRACRDRGAGNCRRRRAGEIHLINWRTVNSQLPSQFPFGAANLPIRCIAILFQWLNRARCLVIARCTCVNFQPEGIMSTQPIEPKPAPPVGLVQIEDIIQQRLAEERARLEREAGVVKREMHQFKRPVERPFTADQRGKTTLLFGGLTWKHEKLVHGALEGLGYLAEAVPTPDVRAFQAGKEYGNNGQCNPTYFTVGNLVQYLQKQEESGMRRDD